MGKIMPKLYIANCSKQEFHFTYMLPENARPFSHHIRAGSQIELNHNQDETDRIIQQHAVYGMMEVGKVKKGFGGLVYRMDKPISVEAIQNGFTQSEQEQIDRALQARTVTAVVTDKMMADRAQELGLRQKAALEVEVVEESKGITDTNENKFNETITVVKDGGAEPARRGCPRKS